MMHEYDSAVKEIPITNKQDWLENRLLDVTSTEVSALFNVNPYQSEFELYNQKKDKVVINIEDNERMAWGRRLEDSIAQGCAESQGWNVEPFDVYLSNSVTRMGSPLTTRLLAKDHLELWRLKMLIQWFIARSGLTMAMAILKHHLTLRCNYNINFMLPMLVGDVLLH